MKYLIAVATAAVLAGAAHAGSIVVSYSSADLASDAAASQFYSTLQKASSSACQDFSRMTLLENRLQKSCRAYALENAVADVGHDRLWAIHNSNAETQIYITEADQQRVKYARIRVVKRQG